MSTAPHLIALSPDRVPFSSSCILRSPSLPSPPRKTLAFILHPSQTISIQSTTSPLLLPPFNLPFPPHLLICHPPFAHPGPSFSCSRYYNTNLDLFVFPRSSSLCLRLPQGLCFGLPQLKSAVSLSLHTHVVLIRPTLPRNSVKVAATTITLQPAMANPSVAPFQPLHPPPTNPFKSCFSMALLLAYHDFQ